MIQSKMLVCEERGMTLRKKFLHGESSFEERGKLISPTFMSVTSYSSLHPCSYIMDGLQC